MANHRAANNGVRSVKHDLVVGQVEDGLTILSGLEVAQVTVMSDGLARSSMDHTLWVPVRASSLAAFRKVAYSKMKNKKLRDRRACVYLPY